MIGVIACVSRIAASVVYAIAPTRAVYFLGPVLDMFSSAGATSLRSMATKLVHSDEIGKLLLGYYLIHYLIMHCDLFTLKVRTSHNILICN